MAQLIVTVNKLNKRNAIPAKLDDKSSIVDTVAKGTIIQAEKVTTPLNPDLGDWYRGSDGFYYWGGGVKENDGLGNPPVTTNALAVGAAQNAQINNWWITDYGIDAIWKKTKGGGIKIAVIDTGLNFNHPSLKSKKNISFYNITNDSTKAEDCIDNEGHGTKCAGMIAAQGPDVWGVSPDSDLLVVKATVNGNLSCQNAALAITKAINLGANIISISYEFNDHEGDFDKLKEAVSFARERNVLIVGSTGNGGEAGIISEAYPASFPSSLGVGAIDKNRNFWDQTKLTNSISILSPGVDISLIGLGNATTIDSGTSYSAPFAAGVCALFLSTKNDINLLLEQIKSTADDKEKIKAQLIALYTDNNISLPVLGIISPTKLFT